MEFWWLLPILGGFVLSIIFTDGVRLFALKRNITDAPNEDRKKHKGVIPLLGGFGIYLTFSVVVLITLWTTGHFTLGAMGNGHIYGLLAGGAILMLGGYLDDRFELKPRHSLIFPLMAAVVAIASGIEVDKITNPAGGVFEIAAWISDVFVFIWLMGMMYTTKLLDGIDGLVSGIGAIALAMIGLVALSTAFFQPDVALLSLIAFSSVLGFLLWNMHPAQIFLGEGGSTFVGYLIGVMAVISGSKVATALLVIGIPALDVAFVMWGRWRNGGSVKQADRSHLHFKLYDRGLGQREVALIYFVISILFGAVTFLFSSWLKLAALGILLVIMTVTFVWLPKRKKQLPGMDA